MPGTLKSKTPIQKRKGRIFREIMRGLSWSTEKRIQVPPALWAKVQDGWLGGPLIGSMNGIADPDHPGVFWSAWMFQNGAIWIQSNQMAPGDFANAWTLGYEAMVGVDDWPTRGI